MSGTTTATREARRGKKNKRLGGFVRFPHLVCLFSFETPCHSPESVGQNKRSRSRAPIKGATTQLPPTLPPPHAVST